MVPCLLIRLSAVCEEKVNSSLIVPLDTSNALGYAAAAGGIGSTI